MKRRNWRCCLFSFFIFQVFRTGGIYAQCPPGTSKGNIIRTKVACYVVHKTLVTWESAREVCRKSGGDMSQLANSYKSNRGVHNSVLKALFFPFGYTFTKTCVWNGLKETDGEWYWIDGSEVDDDTFDMDIVTRFILSWVESCGVICQGRHFVGSTYFQIQAEGCKSTIGFICEYAINGTTSTPEVTSLLPGTPLQTNEGYRNSSTPFSSTMGPWTITTNKVSVTEDVLTPALTVSTTDGSTKSIPFPSQQSALSHRKNRVYRRISRGWFIDAQPLWTKPAYANTMCTRLCATSDMKCWYVNFNKLATTCTAYAEINGSEMTPDKDWEIWHIGE